jgi:hypothetical protein
MALNLWTSEAQWKEDAHVVILAARPAVNEQVKAIYLNEGLSTEAEVYLLGFNGRGFRIFYILRIHQNTHLLCQITFHISRC